MQSQIVKIIVYGAAGTGKTSFMDRITGKPLSEIRVSTPLSGRPVAVYQINMKESEWEKLTPIERKELLIKAAIKAEEEEQSSSDEEDEQTTEVSKTGLVSSNQDTQAKATLPSKSSPSTSKATQGGSRSTFEEMVQLVDQYSRTGDSITSYRKLYLIDSGGQPQFHEILPAFLRHNVSTICIFVFRLCDDLSTKTMIEYYGQRGQIVGVPYESSHTNQQLLENCLRTLRNQVGFSRIAIVGTHRDVEEKEENHAEKRAEKNKKIRKLLLPSFKDKALAYNPSRDEEFVEYIFPVNAKEPEEKDKKVVENFKSLVLDECIPDPKDIPLRYHALEIILEEHSKAVGRGVLSVSECMNAAADLHFEEHTLDQALVFLNLILKRFILQ